MGNQSFRGAGGVGVVGPRGHIANAGVFCEYELGALAREMGSELSAAPFVERSDPVSVDAPVRVNRLPRGAARGCTP